MNDSLPLAYRLYHFTQCLETIDKILTSSGFLVRYCSEDFNWLAGQPKYLMIPMASFCDMPIQNSGDHQCCYGKYAIALSKRWGEEKGLNPLFYVQDNSHVAEYLRRFQRSIQKARLDAGDFGDVWNLLPFLKPTLGSFPKTEQRTTEIKAFEEEMEWRFTHPDSLNLMYVREDDETVAEQTKQTKNRELNNFILPFEMADVEEILVTNDDELLYLSKLHPKFTDRIHVFQCGCDLGRRR